MDLLQMFPQCGSQNLQKDPSVADFAVDYL